MKARSLAELGAMRDLLRTQARAAGDVAATAADARARGNPPAAFADGTFAAAVGPVTPLAGTPRTQHQLARPSAEPRQRQADERAAWREACAGALDVESLLLTDDGLAFRRPGIGIDVLTRLRRGHWSIQAQLDLHGHRRDEAQAALAAFIAEARQRGWRCLRIVHGKGLGSPGRAPVLKARVQRWLARHEAVIAFAQASGPQGGAGALIVLLAGGTR